MYNRDIVCGSGIQSGHLPRKIRPYLLLFPGYKSLIHPEGERAVQRISSQTENPLQVDLIQSSCGYPLLPLDQAVEKADQAR